MNDELLERFVERAEKILSLYDPMAPLFPSVEGAGVLFPAQVTLQPVYCQPPHYMQARFESISTNKLRLSFALDGILSRSFDFLIGRP